MRAILEDKYKCDIVWVIWEIILNKNKNNIFKINILNDLLKLFCIKYSSGIKKTRKYLLYHAILLSIQNVNEQIKIYENKNIINNIVKKIDVIYEQINNRLEETKDNNNNTINNTTNNIINNDINNLVNNNEKNVKKTKKNNDKDVKRNTPKVYDLLNDTSLLYIEKKKNKQNNYQSGNEKTEIKKIEHVDGINTNNKNNKILIIK